MYCRVAYYITHEVQFHISQAWKQPWHEDTASIAWLDETVEGRLDTIQLSAANYLGADRVSSLAAEAWEAGEYWKCAIRNMEAGRTTMTLHGSIHSRKFFRQVVKAIAKLSDASEGAVPGIVKDRLEFDAVLRLVKAWDPVNQPAPPCCHMPRRQQTMQVLVLVLVLVVFI